MKNLAWIFFSFSLVLSACTEKEPTKPWSFEDVHNDTSTRKDTSDDFPLKDVSEDPIGEKDGDMFIGKVCSSEPEEVWFTPKKNIEELEGCEVSLSSISLVDFFEKTVPVTWVGSLRELGPDANLSFRRVPDLENLDSFQNLEKVGKGLSITYAPFLNDISGLQNLRHVGRLKLSSLPLVGLDGLRNLERVDGSFKLSYFTELESLEGLDSLTTIGGDLNVSAPKITEEQFKAFVDRLDIGGNIRFQGEAWPLN